MAERSDQGLLQQTVIAQSTSTNWSEAKGEWDLITIFDEENHCVCRHPIIENCVIKNRNNGQELIVGNVCVNQFKEDHLTVPKSARASLKVLIRGPQRASANSALLEVAHRLKILTDAEKRKYLDMTSGAGARVHFDPSHERFQPWMLDFRNKINGLIAHGFAAGRPRCTCGHFAKPRQNSSSGRYFYSCYYGHYENTTWTSRCEFTQSIF